MNLVQMSRSERPLLSITAVASNCRSESSADACSFPPTRSLLEGVGRLDWLERPARKRKAESQQWSSVVFRKKRVILALRVIGLYHSKLPAVSASDLLAYLRQFDIWRDRREPRGNFTTI